MGNKQQENDNNNNNIKDSSSSTSSSLGYTLSCYSTHSFTFGNHVELPKYKKIFKSQWNKDNFGGSPMFPSFITNPMWHIQIPNKTINTCIMLTCSTTTKNVAINVMLLKVKKDSKRKNNNNTSTASIIRNNIYPLKKDMVLLESGDYRFGFVVTDKLLLSSKELKNIADYNIICVVSTFESNQISDFSLSIYSTQTLIID